MTILVFMSRIVISMHEEASTKAELAWIKHGVTAGPIPLYIHEG
jgi:hypothetical protein